MALVLNTPPLPPAATSAISPSAEAERGIAAPAPADRGERAGGEARLGSGSVVSATVESCLSQGVDCGVGGMLMIRGTAIGVDG